MVIEMQKKDRFKFIIMLLASMVFSLILSYFINNYSVLKLDKKDRIVNDISFDSLQIKNLKYDGKQFIPIDTDNGKIVINYTGFVNKLIVNYTTKDNFYIDVNYNGHDYYDNQVLKSRREGFNSRLNSSVLKIDEDVENITIQLNSNENFSILSIQIDNSVKFNVFLFIFIFFSMALLVILYFYFKYNLFNQKIEYLFLSILLVVGSITIFLHPNVTSISWDDQIHYSYMYRLLDFGGQTHWTEADLDMTEVYPFISIDTGEEKILQDRYLNTAKENIKSETSSSFIQYNQVGYIIPGLVMKISSAVGLPFTLKIILAKFSMLITYALIIFWAIKIIPRGKIILSVIGLFPTNIFLATQFSYDPPITAFLILFTAVYIRVLETKDEKINFKYSLILIFSILFACFIKAIYIPLIILLFLIPKDKFSNKKQHLHFKIGVLLLLILVMATFVFPTVTQTSSLGDLRGGNTSTSGQLKVILNNPVGYMKLLNDNAGTYFFDKVIGEETIINYGYIDSYISPEGNNYDRVAYYVILFLLLFVVITDSYDKDNYKNKKLIKVFNIIIFIGIIVLIWTALYLSFTPVGELTINGVQNRYFIPLIAPLIIISLSNSKIKNTFSRVKYEFIIMSIISIILIYITYIKAFTIFCN